MLLKSGGTSSLPARLLGLGRPAAMAGDRQEPAGIYTRQLVEEGRHIHNAKEAATADLEGRDGEIASSQPVADGLRLHGGDLGNFRDSQQDPVVLS